MTLTHDINTSDGKEIKKLFIFCESSECKILELIINVLDLLHILRWGNKRNTGFRKKAGEFSLKYIKKKTSKPKPYIDIGESKHILTCMSGKDYCLCLASMSVPPLRLPNPSRECKTLSRIWSSCSGSSLQIIKTTS